MTEKELNKIIKQSKSTRYDSRQRAALNPDTPVSIINALITDSDSRVALSAALNPNIDKSTLDTLQATPGIKSIVFDAFLSNDRFQQIWTHQYIDMMNAKHISTLEFLENPKFFSTAIEWFELFKYLSQNQPTWLATSKINGFWSDFYSFPTQEILNVYTEKNTLAVLDFYGVLFKSKPTIFDQILNIDILNTDLIRKKIYEISSNEKYLPKAVQDIFIF